MKVLIIGSGGREHAIAWKISQSPLKPEIFCAPGNAGTASLATNVELGTSNIGALAIWALENKIDLTVVGPETPLAEGIVDIFSEHGLKIFGPTKAAARLESSKSFAKEVMLKAGVTTAKGAIFDDYEKARQYVESKGAPIVIKADGLAAGKGVVVAKSLEDAFSALEDFMLRSRHGSSGKTVVIEECLIGEEASVIALVDGNTVLPLVVSQDYKRVFDDNEGPNTGGMGAISPSPVLSDKRVENLIGEVFMPVIRELLNRGVRYTGFLYAGVLVDKQGTVHVIEFNCRLGDPETQVLMMRLRTDLLEVIKAAVENKLSSVELRWRGEPAACVVLCSKGYPEEVEDGKVISGLEKIHDSSSNEFQVFHSGTRNSEGRIITKGGRILCVSALGGSLSEAVKKAYEGVEQISFDGMHYRRDIGGKN